MLMWRFATWLDWRRGCCTDPTQAQMIALCLAGLFICGALYFPARNHDNQEQN